MNTVRGIIIWIGYIFLSFTANNEIKDYIVSDIVILVLQISFAF